MAAVTPYQPQWLRVEDVKAWLRLNAQDTGDDDLLSAAAAMAEPYVQRCRPEWAIHAVREAALMLDSDYYSTQVAVRVDSWETSHPTQPLTDGRSHLVQLVADPADDWAVANPDAAVLVTYHDGDTLVASALQHADATPVSVAEALVWVTRHTGLLLRQGSAAWQATDQLMSYLPDAETYQGAVMYAAREYRRRNSPAGVEMFGDVTSFVSRFDPDIDRALQTGSYARPVVS
jgi:hypothetical protein